jgi:hypothetical protein
LGWVHVLSIKRPKEINRQRGRLTTLEAWFDENNFVFSFFSGGCEANPGEKRKNILYWAANPVSKGTVSSRLRRDETAPYIGKTAEPLFWQRLERTEDLNPGGESVIRAFCGGLEMNTKIKVHITKKGRESQGGF